jgi:hypothetical protein
MLQFHGRRHRVNSCVRKSLILKKYLPEGLNLESNKDKWGPFLTKFGADFSIMIFYGTNPFEII